MIRCVSAAVRYDGALDVELIVSGFDDPVRRSFDGNEHTLLLNWSQVPQSIDLGGTSAVERRRREIVGRGVSRLREQLERRRAATRWQRQAARERAEALDW